MVNFDPLYLITIISVSIAAIVGVFTIRSEIKKTREESALKIVGQIDTMGAGVKEHIDERFHIMDSKFDSIDVKITEDKSDIQDIEVDMKQMQFDLKDICGKLAKHDYVIEAFVPEFKALLKDFYIFKTIVDNLDDDQRIILKKKSDKTNESANIS